MSSLPLLVAGVFAITFAVVFAVGYRLSVHRGSGGTRNDSPTGPAMPTAPQRKTERTSVEPDAVKRKVDARVGSTSTTIVRFYRVLMILTGVAGLLASTLMFLAAESLLRIAVPALIVLILGCVALVNAIWPSKSITGNTDSTARRPPSSR